MAKRKPPVERNQSIHIEIEALNSECQGVGRLDGYAIFVPGALPGEQVEALVIKPGKGYGVARLERILRPSNARVAPPCEAFGRCGGCALQHLAYPAQLLHKQRVVQDAFLRLGGLAVDVAPAMGMDSPWQYRNKGSFPIAMQNGRAEIGFFATHSHRLIPLNACMLQGPDIFPAAQAVRDWANEYDLPCYEEQGQSGGLRHVVARATSTGELMVTIVSAKRELPHIDALIEILERRVPSLASLYVNYNPDNTNVILGEEYRLLYGNAQIEEKLCGLYFLVSPASFLQVNHTQAERLYTAGLNALALTGGERVVDAYCGIGTLTLLLARQAREVVGIEYVAAAVADAEKNAARNGIQNARFLAGDAAEQLAALCAEGYAPDALVLDPPRKGAEEAFLQCVLQSGVKKVLYISCDPGTLARDCAILTAGGYAVLRVQPVDLFCQAKGVESVCLLEHA